MTTMSRPVPSTWSSGDPDPLMIEVGHYHLEALVLFADEVGDGDFDVFEGYVGCARGPDALAVHASGADAAHAALDEQHGDAVCAGAAGTDCRCKVLAPYAVGDPFLLAIYDVVFAVFGKFGFTC